MSYWTFSKAAGSLSTSFLNLGSKNAECAKIRLYPNIRNLFLIPSNNALFRSVTTADRTDACLSTRVLQPCIIHCKIMVQRDYREHPSLLSLFIGFYKFSWTYMLSSNESEHHLLILIHCPIHSSGPGLILTFQQQLYFYERTHYFSLFYGCSQFFQTTLTMRFSVCAKHVKWFQPVNLTAFIILCALSVTIVWIFSVSHSVNTLKISASRFSLVWLSENLK